MTREGQGSGLNAGNDGRAASLGRRLAISLSQRSHASGRVGYAFVAADELRHALADGDIEVVEIDARTCAVTSALRVVDLQAKLRRLAGVGDDDEQMWRKSR